MRKQTVKMWNRRLLAAVMLGIVLTGGSAVTLQAEETGAAAQTAVAEGTYSVPEGWSEDTAERADGSSVYRRSELLSSDSTSTITCSYAETHYSVLEYEQLREMLKNDMVYSKVNAEISSSASYTDNKDYLFILTADDAASDYREIVYYVIGDMKYFSVAVKEYRSEAESDRAAARKTPEETGEEIAMKFVW